MKALAALLLVALLAAGCVSQTTTTTTPSSPPPAPRVRLDPPASLTFAPAVDLGQMSGGAEPGIAAGVDGTVYVTTPLALWRSDDNGTTWTDLGGPACPLGIPTCAGLASEESPSGMQGGGDAAVWVTPDGHVHWLGLGPNIPYQVSTDKGVTWSKPYDVSNKTGADREWITGRPDGTLLASWRDEKTIRMARSDDEGGNWTVPVDVAPDTRQGGIAIDPTGMDLALAHDLGGDVQVAHSFDNGATWTSVKVVANPRQGHVFPVTAFDANGTLYLAYAADKAPQVPPVSPSDTRPLETPSVYLHVSHDKGLTWTPAVQVNAPGTSAWFPWIAAGAQGKVVLTWYQNDKGLPRYAADEVYATMGISLDADYAAPRFVTAHVTADPIHKGPECRELPPCSRSLLDFFQVAIPPDGHPVLAFASDTWPAPYVHVNFAKATGSPDLLH